VGRSPCLSFGAISAFSDGELPEEERQEAERHIAACERCSAEVGSVGRVDAVLAAPPPIGCSSALLLLSACHDRELTLSETLVAESHVVRCLACRASISEWSKLDDAISALPAAQPSRRVDVAIHALVGEKSHLQGGRGLVAGIALRGAIAIGLVVAVAVAALQQPARPQLATEATPSSEQQSTLPLPPINRTQALVASANQVVFNARTNTLYVAHPDDGTVGALNATSLADITTIAVGGRPSALALNEEANTVLVLDTGQKVLTEIDGHTNRVVGTTALAVEGTPNAIQVANGRIVVAVSDQPQSQAASPSGSVVVLDSSSKKLETTRSVGVGVRQVVLDPSGDRAMLVSEDVVTVVDAATYRPLDQLPGGVSAAFAAHGSSTAVLSPTQGRSRVTITGDQTAVLTLFGSPIAIIALPKGGFAVLVDEEDRGRIVEIAADGTPGRSTSVTLVGRDLTYNASMATYAVAGPGGVASAVIGGVASVTSPSAAPNAQTPGNSGGSAVANPSAPPSSARVVPAVPSAGPTVERNAVSLPDGATLAWHGMYRFDLIGRAAPMVVGRGRARHLWFVDSANRLTSLDAASGNSYTIAELPAEARIRSIEVGSSFVYAIDVAASRVYVVALPSEKVSPIQLPFVKSSAAVTVTPDDRLWFAVADQILALDPRNGRVEAVNVGLYSVGALAADSAGRVWFSDESQKRIGLYDRNVGGVVELALPRIGSVRSMVVDATGTLWAGTDAGELFAIRNGALVGSANLGRPVQGLALDSLGAAWFLSGNSSQSALGKAQTPTVVRAVPASISGLWFDARGDAWLADRSSAGFFIAVPETR
jgi:streptogramin lyase/anti-sigma factor RsiW